ncbi:MAG: bifunctional isocitrate dehydrogenase kinase/phosphatase [Pseudomonadota bacterium]
MANNAAIREATATLVAAFERYNADFRRVTKRTQRRFERQDWANMQLDAVERIELYGRSVRAATGEVRSELGDDCENREVWSAIKGQFGTAIADRIDREFYQTFFSSVTRRIFRTVGVDPAIEFVAEDVTPSEYTLDQVRTRKYAVRGSLEFVFDEMLTDYRFGTAYRNTEKTVAYLAAELDAYCRTRRDTMLIRRIEMLATVFFRGTRAYLVGRLHGSGWESPLVIALRNSDEGIYADAVIVSTNDVSMLFGFTRSYFHADLEAVGPVVSFLRALLPQKPIAEIYTVLGRAKQGKTERYRHFFQHLAQSPMDDRFVHASGDKGMVMEVFTLPSYDVVFKLIRDRFAYPKTMSRQDVKDKYTLVFKHDRAGRLVDAQEFRRLEFSPDRFAPELLDALLTGCSKTCRLEDNRVIIDHLYIERRLAPLNLYLKDAAADGAKAATIDYGQAIRDLANSNIFAGDLLLKNFGVTRHGRVIFYDYDELCLVTECNFRALPQAQDDVDEMRADAWYYVGPNDIFPEQFVQFLGFAPELRTAFLEHHADLLDPDYWNALKSELENGVHRDVLPYATKSWIELVQPGLYRPAFRPTTSKRS